MENDNLVSIREMTFMSQSNPLTLYNFSNSNIWDFSHNYTNLNIIESERFIGMEQSLNIENVSEHLW